MSKLQIEQLTDQVQLEKNAEEAQMEKVAAVMQVVDQASTLTSVGEELFKVAEELENENLKALASDIYQTGERMGAALTKLASENGVALEESLEIAEDLNKLATVMAEIAEEVQNEEFTKMAEAVVTISNELTEEANAVTEQMEKEASILASGKSGMEHLTEAEKEAARLAVKNQAAADLKKPIGGTVSHGRTLKGQAFSKGLQVKMLAKAHPKTAIAGAAAALAAAGYGAHKAYAKK